MRGTSESGHQPARSSGNDKLRKPSNNEGLSRNLFLELRMATLEWRENVKIPKEKNSGWDLAVCG
jgi:hypothetical protein